MSEVKRRYPFVIGMLFGVVQTGYFFQFNFVLASTYATLLLVTIAWLMGSVIGLRVSSRIGCGPWFCVLPYGATLLVLGWLPFQSDIWPVYGLFILASGIFSGLFFARLGEIVRPVRRLFFWENNGFIAGIAVCTLTFLSSGRGVLVALPAVLGLLCWWWTPRKVSATRRVRRMYLR